MKFPSGMLKTSWACRRQEWENPEHAYPDFLVMSQSWGWRRCDSHAAAANRRDMLAVCGLAPDAPKPESVARLNAALSIHAQFPFRPWPNRLHSVAKRSRVHAQRKVLASL